MSCRNCWKQHTLFSGLALNFLNNVSLSRAGSPSEAISSVSAPSLHFCRNTVWPGGKQTASSNRAGTQISRWLQMSVFTKDPPPVAHRSPQIPNLKGQRQTQRLL